MKNLATNHMYNAEISAGSLMLRESRKVAGLLLDKADDMAWHHALSVDNILQKKVPATARRMAKLIRNRLELMTPESWEMVIHGNSEVAMQSLLAAAIKHSRLLGDFLNEVVKDHYKVFNKQLTVMDWKNFLAACAQRDGAVASWSDTTRAKLGQVVLRILTEAKYVDSTRSLKLTPVSLAPEVRKYLASNKETYVLRCMDVAHE
ncbi:MAG TPA: DUF1819 family protein [Syntrophales bacterium]|nr:DUF1819 family protein [Syntrophales bacterium]